MQSVALAESPHANRILGVKTAENYATGFRAYVRSSEVCANATVLLDAENTAQPDALLRRLSEHGGLTLVNDDGYLTGPPAFIEVSLGRTEQQRNKG